VFCPLIHAQPVTGVWKGKVNNRNVELKLVKTGDSLVGNAYYGNRNNYSLYSIKGYFDPETNNVIWWDDELLMYQVTRTLLHQSADRPLLNVADFNCPGEDEMRLDGTSSNREDRDHDQGKVQLQKVKQSQFRDDWDWVIANYTVGANDPELIDSIRRSMVNRDVAVNEPSPKAEVPKPREEITPTQPAPGAAPPVIATNNNRSRFDTRKKVLQQVIPFDGRALQLKFFDNAEIDGDSIAVFLNGQLLAEHVRLTDQAFVIAINEDQLQDDNELVMVAENLGTIPPNTSLMTVRIGQKEYEAHLYSTEKASALIRFVRQIPSK
jgi:hypothetical protein